MLCVVHCICQNPGVLNILCNALVIKIMFKSKFRWVIYAFFLFCVPYKVKHGSSKKCWSVLRGQYLCYYKSEDDAVSNFPKIQYNCALSGLLCVPFLGFFGLKSKEGLVCGFIKDCHGRASH